MAISLPSANALVSHSCEYLNLLTASILGNSLIIDRILIFLPMRSRYRLLLLLQRSFPDIFEEFVLHEKAVMQAILLKSTAFIALQY